MQILITDKKIIMDGNGKEMLIGLATFVNKLKEFGAPTEAIEQAVEVGLMSDKEKDEMLEKIEREKKDFKNKLQDLFKSIEEEI